jgi:hypothetical protein
MLPRLQLATALNHASLVSAHGPWSRAIGYRHLLGPPAGQTGGPQPLWRGAVNTTGARFTPAGRIDSIYLAHDPITAFIEVSALILLPGGPVPVRSAPWVVISVDGVLNGLLDLTNPATLAALGTTTQEMTGTWAATPDPPSNCLGNSPTIPGASPVLAMPPPNIPAVSMSWFSPTAFPLRLAIIWRFMTLTAIWPSASSENEMNHR